MKEDILQDLKQTFIYGLSIGTLNNIEYNINGKKCIIRFLDETVAGRVQIKHFPYLNGLKPFIMNYLNGKRHCENKPAGIWSDGYVEWWHNGKVHRIDGPAIITQNGKKQWYIDDENLTETEFAIWQIDNKI